MEYRFLKLVNGDDLIVTTDDSSNTLEGKEYLSVLDPVLITSMRFPRGPMIIESFIMQPWAKMAKKDVINIPTKFILISTEVQDMALKQYQDYVVETNNNMTMKTDSVDFQSMDDEEEEEQTFEQFLQGAMTDNDEEDDDDGNTNIRNSRRTFH